MNYVYGPVPSRRLGRSLGIDTVPLKTCNWNCVYCQLGRSTPVINVRREYLPKEAIVEEVRQALSLHAQGDIDWITFVASGETTLHNGLGWMIRRVKQLTDLPLAVITNGSLLHRPELREELSACDAVLPTLDAGSAELYRRLNRPHTDFTFERHVEGLIAFRHRFSGKLWIEVMLVAGENDTESALEDLRLVLKRIDPDEVHLLSPTRSPVETWVRATDQEGFMRAAAILGETARLAPALEVSTVLGGTESIMDALVSILARHPMSESQLERALTHWAPGHVEETIRRLRADPRVQTIRRSGAVFWVGTKGVYPNP